MNHLIRLSITGSLFFENFSMILFLVQQEVRIRILSYFAEKFQQQTGNMKSIKFFLILNTHISFKAKGEILF